MITYESFYTYPTIRGIAIIRFVGVVLFDKKVYPLDTWRIRLWIQFLRQSIIVVFGTIENTTCANRVIATQHFFIVCILLHGNQ